MKGLWLRARAGPVRDHVTTALAAIPLPAKRLHPTITDDTLFGGLDLTATLATGSPSFTEGLLAQPALLILAMAERCPPGLAARLAAALDTPSHCLIALDESADPDETLAPTLTDRLALFLDLSDQAWSDTAPLILDATAIATARALLPKIITPPDTAHRLTEAAARLGITALRAPLLALATARAAAARAGRTTVTEADLLTAAELTYGHRALPLSDMPDQPQPEPPQDQPDRQTESRTNSQSLPEELLVEAARAALPADLLQRLAAGRAARAVKGATGTGAAKSGNRRGRPLPSRPGRLGTGARIDLVATLRAAAPWQGVRRKLAGQAPTAIPSPQGKGEASNHPPLSTQPAATSQAPPSPLVGEGWGRGATRPAPLSSPRINRLLIRPADIRLKRFIETSDRVLIFAVDASGSAAFARLAEAKGAIELLLAAAYSRRDHVALLAFRGTVAELILPPTRSLVQTKRRLAGLPGGGGTPLALGLKLAMATAQQARARGLTPTIAILTDGRGNIALDGTANRDQAEADALQFARLIRATATPALVIDTANRPQPGLQLLARQMDAPYLALPRADAHRLSSVLQTALGD